MKPIRHVETKQSKPEQYRYRAENHAGELIGYVRATDEGDARRKASLKWGAMGLQVRRAGG